MSSMPMSPARVILATVLATDASTVARPAAIVASGRTSGPACQRLRPCAPSAPHHSDPCWCRWVGDELAARGGGSLHRCNRAGVSRSRCGRVGCPRVAAPRSGNSCSSAIAPWCSAPLPPSAESHRSLSAASALGTHEPPQGRDEDLRPLGVDPVTGTFDGHLHRAREQSPHRGVMFGTHVRRPLARQPQHRSVEPADQLVREPADRRQLPPQQLQVGLPPKAGAAGPEILQQEVAYPSVVDRRAKLFVRLRAA